MRLRWIPKKMRTKTYITKEENTMKNIIDPGEFIICTLQKVTSINGNKNKTSSRRWFLDPYLGGKGNVEMVLSLRFTRNVDEKMVVFLYRRCKESNKTYEKYHICFVYIYIYIYVCVYIILCLLEICWRSCFMIILYLFFLCNSESGIQLQQHQEHQPSRYCIARGNEVCYLWLHSMKEEELVTTLAKETSEWMWSHDGPFFVGRIQQILEMFFGLRMRWRFFFHRLSMSLWCSKIKLMDVYQSVSNWCTDSWHLIHC